MPASGRDEDIFDDPRHMSCDNFIFPVDQVGLPFKPPNVSFCFAQSAPQDLLKEIRPINALEE